MRFFWIWEYLALTGALLGLLLSVTWLWAKTTGKRTFHIFQTNWARLGVTITALGIVYYVFTGQEPSSAGAKKVRQFTCDYLVCYDVPAWERAERQNTVSSYQKYLKEYPKGEYTQTAKQNISSIRNAQADSEAWQRAEQVNTLKEYQRYLSWFPSGAYTRQARAKISVIEQVEAERQAKLEAERLSKLEAERQAKLEAERLSRLEAERQAKLEAERLSRLEAERQAKLEAERLSRLEAERQAKLEAERQAKLEAERLSRLEAESKAKLEAERQAKIEAESKAKLDTERKATVQATVPKGASIDGTWMLREPRAIWRFTLSRGSVKIEQTKGGKSIYRGSYRLSGKTVTMKWRGGSGGGSCQLSGTRTMYCKWPFGAWNGRLEKN